MHNGKWIYCANYLKKREKLLQFSGIKRVEKWKTTGYNNLWTILMPKGRGAVDSMPFSMRRAREVTYKGG